jgi:hypothetical protein
MIEEVLWMGKGYYLMYFDSIFLSVGLYEVGYRRGLGLIRVKKRRQKDAIPRTCCKLHWSMVFEGVA